MEKEVEICKNVCIDNNTFCGLVPCGLLFSLSIDGETGSGLERRRVAMPISRRTFGLGFTEPFEVSLMLNTSLKRL